MKKIAMFGICGRMGRAISQELVKEKDIELIAGFDSLNKGKDIGEILGIGNMNRTITDSYEDIKKELPDIIIDFTIASIAKKTIVWAINNSIDIIVGTTGLDSQDLDKFKKMAGESDSKVFIVPNFAIGAVVMMKISGRIAKYFDDCEIIEMHHDRKHDAPSGTSIATAENISKNKVFSDNRLKSGEKENIKSSRGGFGKGIHIHSIRLPGLVAHQNVLFGAKGQTLSIRHDSMDRSSFYPGVIMAVRNIEKLSNYTFGLDELIDI